jgi:hypothetical protein
MKGPDRWLVEPVFHRRILKASLGRNEQKTKATPKPKPSTKGKSKPEAGRLHGSRIVTGSLEVSLDNADTVIEGAPSFSRTLRKGWVMELIGAR